MSKASNDGRRPDGKFARGNRGGPGRPRLAHLTALRDAVYSAVEPGDVAQVLQSLKAQALAGDTTAAVAFLRRVLGPEVSADIVLRLEEIERLLQEQTP